jgi:hypothetical protein
MHATKINRLQVGVRKNGGEYSDGGIQLCENVSKKANKVIKNKVVNDKGNLSQKHRFHPTLLYNFDDLQVVTIYSHLIQPHHNYQVLSQLDI